MQVERWATINSFLSLFLIWLLFSKKGLSLGSEILQYDYYDSKVWVRHLMCWGRFLKVRLQAQLIDFPLLIIIIPSPHFLKNSLKIAVNKGTDRLSDQTPNMIT